MTDAATTTRPRGVLRANYAPMRVRCDADDGTAAHDAFDIQMPSRVGPRSPVALLAKCSRCACGAGMVVLYGDAAEPMAAHAARVDEGPAGELRANHAPMRARCERDDGTSAHYAIDFQAPLSLRADSPLLLASRARRCQCGGALLMLDSVAEEPMARNAREAARGR